MIVVLKSGAKQEDVEKINVMMSNMNIETSVVVGASQTIIGLIGDITKVDIDLLQSLEVVEKVKRIQEPFKNANKKFHSGPLVVDINGTKIGGGNFQVIAGPCSVESKEQVTEVAEAVKAAGAGFLRGGAFKPRTSPYAFQGMAGDGIELLVEAKKATGLPLVSELMSMDHFHLFEPIDIIQIGARNMQNFEMLKEIGKTDKVILLKRGLANTIDELLMSAEYIMAGGNENVILCERGIRTFETRTRNTLDLSIIPVLKELTHLPVVIDPSHACGYHHMVKPMAMAAAAAGADGLMVEVHNDPENALCDGPQSLTPKKFHSLMESINHILPYACKYE